MEVTFDGNKVITAHLYGHIIKTDQPVEGGGNDSAPTPFDLFLASIGTCAGIFIKGFCDNRGLSTDGIKLIQNMQYDPESGLPTDITIDIQVPATFPERYIPALIHVADLCKVKRTMANPPAFEVKATVI